jgi:hypothetical protein
MLACFGRLGRPGSFSRVHAQAQSIQGESWEALRDSWRLRHAGDGLSLVEGLARPLAGCRRTRSLVVSQDTTQKIQPLEAAPQAARDTTTPRRERRGTRARARPAAHLELGGEHPRLARMMTKGPEVEERVEVRPRA